MNPFLFDEKQVEVHIIQKGKSISDEILKNLWHLKEL